MDQSSWISSRIAERGRKSLAARCAVGVAAIQHIHQQIAAKPCTGVALIVVIHRVCIDRIKANQGLVGAHHHKQQNIACFRQLVSRFLELVVYCLHTATEAAAVMALRIEGFDRVGAVAQRDTTVR